MGIQDCLESQWETQKACAALSVTDAGDNDWLEEAILRWYDVTEESYRQCFRLGKRGDQESNQELVAWLSDLATKWLKLKS